MFTPLFTPSKRCSQLLVDSYWCNSYTSFHKSTVEDAATQQDARQEAQLSARKRRSAKRMHEFVQRKHLEQLANCKLRLTLLKALRRLRWERVQAVWTSWMRANARAVLAVPMLLEPSEQAAPPSTPHKIKKRTVEERSPDKAGPASGAAHASPPTTAEGKQPRMLTYTANSK